MFRAARVFGGCISLLASLALAQGLEPRASVGDYAAQGVIRGPEGDEIHLGADFLVRSIPSPDGAWIAGNYLVIETAVFGPALARAALSPTTFVLYVNGSKRGLLGQQPFVVAGSFRPPPVAWDPSRGDVRVIGPNGPARQGDVVRPPPYSAREDNREEIRVTNVVTGSALPAGSDVKLPVAGFLYFRYTGKPDEIRSLELTYEGPSGRGSVKLR
jgi:hypothetical protein